MPLFGKWRDRVQGALRFSAEAEGLPRGAGRNRACAARRAGRRGRSRRTPRRRRPGTGARGLRSSRLLGLDVCFENPRRGAARALGPHANRNRGRVAAVVLGQDRPREASPAREISHRAPDARGGAPRRRARSLRGICRDRRRRRRRGLLRPGWELSGCRAGPNGARRPGVDDSPTPLPLRPPERGSGRRGCPEARAWFDGKCGIVCGRPDLVKDGIGAVDGFVGRRRRPARRAQFGVGPRIGRAGARLPRRAPVRLSAGCILAETAGRPRHGLRRGAARARAAPSAATSS